MRSKRKYGEYDGQRKRTKKDELQDLCEEIRLENEKKWRKRKIEETEKREKLLKEETESYERGQRLKKAAEKKKELLRKLEKQSKVPPKKSGDWIRSRQNIWRKYGLGREKTVKSTIFNGLSEK